MGAPGFVRKIGRVSSAGPTTKLQLPAKYIPLINKYVGLAYNSLRRKIKDIFMTTGNDFYSERWRSQDIKFCPYLLSKENQMKHKNIAVKEFENYIGQNFNKEEYYAVGTFLEEDLGNDRKGLVENILVKLSKPVSKLKEIYRGNRWIGHATPASNMIDLIINRKLMSADDARKVKKEIIRGSEGGILPNERDKLPDPNPGHYGLDDIVAEMEAEKELLAEQKFRSEEEKDDYYSDMLDADVYGKWGYIDSSYTNSETAHTGILIPIQNWKKAPGYDPASNFCDFTEKMPDFHHEISVNGPIDLTNAIFLIARSLKGFVEGKTAKTMHLSIDHPKVQKVLSQVFYYDQEIFDDINGFVWYLTETRPGQAELERHLNSRKT